MAGQKVGFGEGFVLRFSEQHYDGGTIGGVVQWKSWDNRATSMKVKPGTVVAAFEEEEFGGECIVVRGPAEVDLAPLQWDARISSAAVLRCNDLKGLGSIVDIYP